MIWKNKELKTVGDHIEAMRNLKGQREPKKFIDLVRQENPQHANRNIGYLTGYFNGEDAKRLRSWLMVSHPFFGDLSPSPKEAFQLGKWMGEKARREREGEDFEFEVEPE